MFAFSEKKNFPPPSRDFEIIYKQARNFKLYNVAKNLNAELFEVFLEKSSIFLI